MVFANMPQQQLSIGTGVFALLAWKRFKGVMAASVKVQTLLLDTERENISGSHRFTMTGL